jgi:hypothetical protein
VTDEQAKKDKDVIAKAVIALGAMWSFMLLLPWISLTWFPVKSPKDVERIQLTLSGAERTCNTMKYASRLTDQAQIPNPFNAKWFGSPSNAWVRAIELQVSGMF